MPQLVFGGRGLLIIAGAFTFLAATVGAGIGTRLGDAARFFLGEAATFLFGEAAAFLFGTIPLPLGETVRFGIFGTSALKRCPKGALPNGIPLGLGPAGSPLGGICATLGTPLPHSAGTMAL